MAKAHHMSNEETLKAREYLDRSIRRTKNRLLTLLLILAGAFTVLMNVPQ